jgi:hypothetical protein
MHGFVELLVSTAAALFIALNAEFPESRPSGTTWDFPENSMLPAEVGDAWSTGKIVTALESGPRPQSTSSFVS